jgi:hypothetical protein
LWRRFVRAGALSAEQSLSPSSPALSQARVAGRTSRITFRPLPGVFDSSIHTRAARAAKEIKAIVDSLGLLPVIEAGSRQPLQLVTTEDAA